MSTPGLSFPSGGKTGSGETSPCGSALAWGKDNVLRLGHSSYSPNAICLSRCSTRSASASPPCSRMFTVVSYSWIVVHCSFCWGEVKSGTTYVIILATSLHPCLCFIQELNIYKYICFNHIADIILYLAFISHYIMGIYVHMIYIDMFMIICLCIWCIWYTCVLYMLWYIFFPIIKVLLKFTK